MIKPTLTQIPMKKEQVKVGMSEGGILNLVCTE